MPPRPRPSPERSSSPAMRAIHSSCLGAPSPTQRMCGSVRRSSSLEVVCYPRRASSANGGDAAPTTCTPGTRLLEAQPGSDGHARGSAVEEVAETRVRGRGTRPGGCIRCPSPSPCAGCPRRRRIHASGIPSGTDRKASSTALRRAEDRCDSTVVCTLVRHTYAPGLPPSARSTTASAARALLTGSTR